MAYINSYKDQNWLIPQSIRDMIPKDHICFFVEEFVDSLDYTNFDMISEGVGHPSYPPRIPMKVIIQGMLLRKGHQESLQVLAEKTLFLCIWLKKFSQILEQLRDLEKIIKNL